MKITQNILQRLYAKYQIRRKVVRMVKVPPPGKAHDYERLREMASMKLQAAVDKGVKVIYVDEVAFTKKTIQTRDYSNKYENLQLNELNVNTDYFTAVASISAVGCVEHVLINKGAIDGKAYGRFLK